MAEPQHFLPVYSAPEGHDSAPGPDGKSDSENLSSFSFHGFQVWYGRPKRASFLGTFGAKLRQAHEHWPYARRLFSDIFKRDRRLVLSYIISVMVLTIAPAISLCASFGLLLLIERGLNNGTAFHVLIDGLRVYAPLWFGLMFIYIHAKHTSVGLELRLQSHLRRFWDGLIRKSLELSIDKFNRYSMDYNCALPNESSFALSAPCEAFVHDMVEIPCEMLLLGLQILALIVVCAIRGVDESRLLLVFAGLQPLIIWFCPTNITHGQGFTFRNANPAFYHLAELAELASNLRIRRTLMKDNACTALAESYSAASAQLVRGNIPPQRFAYAVAGAFAWPWSLLRGLIVDEPIVLGVFLLPWSQPASSLVTIILLQQTTQLLRSLRGQDATSSFDKFIASLVWAKTGYYDVMALSNFPSGTLSYPSPFSSPAGMKIEFRNVALTHGPHFADEIKEPAVKNLSFTINPGNLVVVVGANGGGKSSVLGLLTRTWEASEGEILIDDKLVEEYDLAQLRGAITAVEQDEDLYPGVTLRESIFLGLDCSSASEQEKVLTQAAHLGCATEIIKRLPRHWDTVIYPTSETYSSEGTGLTQPALAAFRQVERQMPQKFSGGEMQRLTATRMFARLLLLKVRARLIVFDEATSKMDPLAEREILTSLNGQRNGRTIVIATHDYGRLVKEADLVLVMKEGQLVEVGTHDALLWLEGEYGRLYKAHAEGVVA
ncbi:p-loop containing nucleoside triphosphate hydrolase protein [Mycena indigotica]|uniref:p-loop containing nucleoside triphosphate hydrolase protein n=1 Tax=Mycena indigotica TaxID=2126181 RepID=A0A8H6T7V1_9AGAR|nr:p-loop containing nucleoside triphosphate hydrolase protein [Mycena indigotica]KAF7312394.1 p-loop containing nucleoside triphosphate hydrolase protein [Mycena indigotica]